MALTLDSNLQTAQDGMEHQPLCRIQSSDFQDPIPFQGNLFNYENNTNYSPMLIETSDTRLVAVFVDDGEFKVKYTDTTRSIWTVSSVSFNYGGGTYTPVGATLVELSNDRFGIVGCFTAASGTDYYIRYATFKLDGTIITDFTTIISYTASGVWVQDSPHVIESSTGNYLLVYAMLSGGTYSIEKHTSSGWGSFGGASSIALTGLTTSNTVDNASLIKLADGDIFLAFDHADTVSGSNEIHNIYTMLSADNGSSFSAPTARTTYTDWGSNAIQPIFAQKSDGTLWLIFVDRRNVQLLTSWDSDDASAKACRHVHYDSANDKIIMVYGNLSAGFKTVDAVVVIDRTTFTVDKSYYTGSTPALSAIFSDGTKHSIFNSSVHGEGKYVALGLTTTPGTCLITVIDTDGDTVTNYVFNHDDGMYCDDDLASYGLYGNTPMNTGAAQWYNAPETMALCIDASNDNLWVVFKDYYRIKSWAGSIDLTAAPVSGEYDINLLDTDGSTWWSDNVRNKNEGICQVRYASDYDYLIVCTKGASVSSHFGGIVVLQASDGAVVKEYTPEQNGSMCPYPEHIYYYSDHIYGSFEYNSDVDYADQRGLMDIDLNNDTVNYYRPGYATKDQYWFYGFAADGNGGIWLAAAVDCIAYFDMSATSFTQYDKDTFPGIEGGEDDTAFAAIAYDSTNGMIMAGAYDYWLGDSQYGVYMFQEDGPLRRLKYNTAVKNGSWGFGTEANLTYPTAETDPGVIVDTDDQLWVFWTRIDYETGSYYMAWDNDAGAKTLSDYLTGAVVLNHQLKRPNRLSFSVSMGHLFDPQNKNSSLSPVLDKGRKITLEFGETYNDTNYYQAQGTFIVDEINMSYSRGQHPVLKVNCTDMGWLWDKADIAVTDHYSNDAPDTIIKDLVTQWGGITSGDYTIASFTGSHTIYHQWLDMTLGQILEEILDHFFYTAVWDVDGKYVTKHVNLDKAVDHTYSVSDKLTAYTPDLSYSDYTNRVTVVGETDDYVEVLYDEESITTLTGTIGWWGRDKDITVYYSDDHKKRCRNPRLVVNQSLSEFSWLAKQLGHVGGEELSYEDPEDYYCIVSLDSPNLMLLFGILVAIAIALAIMAIICILSCGKWILAVTLAIAAVLYLLAMVASYSYEIWAKPIGRVRQTIQCVANDTAMQNKLDGIIVEEKIDDPLCATVNQCCTVATGNLRLIKAQRNRILFTKVTHLQDEVLDMISVPHPYSGEAMEVLITGLTRTYNKGNAMTDKIEGWRITADI